MRSIPSILLSLVLPCCLPAQEPEPPRPAGTGEVGVKKVSEPDKVAKTGKQETGKQETGKRETGKRETGKQETGKQDPTAQGQTAKGTENGGAKKKGPAGEAKDKAKEEPVLRGTDPADIAAMRSARAMLKAEKRLAAMLKAGKIKGIDRVLPFEEIASWPYDDALKGMPKKLLKLEGKKVMMTGFMLPIDEVENIKEFLLVQSLWSCCYGQPPDINGTVRVVMQGKKRIDYKFEPIKVIGIFRIKATVEEGFCVDIYQLETTDVQVIK